MILQQLGMSDAKTVRFPHLSLFPAEKRDRQRFVFYVNVK